MSWAPADAKTEAALPAGVRQVMSSGSIRAVAAVRNSGHRQLLRGRTVADTRPELSGVHSQKTANGAFDQAERRRQLRSAKEIPMIILPSMGSGENRICSCGYPCVHKGGG